MSKIHRKAQLGILLVGLWGCAGRAESETREKSPSQPDDESVAPVVVGSGGSAEVVAPAAGGALLPVLPPDEVLLPPTCDVTPLITVTNATGSVILDGPFVASNWDAILNTVQCGGGRTSQLEAFESEGAAMGGATAPTFPGAGITLNFESYSAAGTWVVEGTGQYVSPSGERFSLVLDQQLAASIFEGPSHLETTIRYQGANESGQTAWFDVALSVCAILQVCTI
jgi:hypothetical protein